MQRLSLANEFLEGENNVYLFAGDAPALVDAGFDSPEVREQLRDGLAEHGLAFADVERVFLTHYHVDHAGLAAAIQQAGGATVYAHPADAPLVRGDEDAWAAVVEQRRQRYDEWGVPPAKQAELEDTMIEEAATYDQDISVTPLGDGEEFTAGGEELRVMHTPGHTKGHVALALPEQREVLSGDALLPQYTPNVGGADVRLERPLDHYLETLERLADGSFRRAWPGHRTPIDDPTARARAIVDHHEERSWRVASLLSSEGPLTAWEVSGHLFGGLEGIHILHGPGETYAHLDHLYRTGAAERDGANYRLTREGAATLDGLSTDAWPLV